jgi:predicted nucleotidyltransferase
MICRELKSCHSLLGGKTACDLSFDLGRETYSAPPQALKSRYLMRITEREISIIKQVIASQLGSSDAKISLFGSRINDEAKGGDIDLLVETTKVQENAASIASKIVAGLQIQMGDQQIDVVLIDPQTQILPIHEYARENGIKL